MITQCTCAHPAQDAMYGNNNRVHNPTKDGKTVRCVVCSKEKTVKKDEKEK